MGDHYYRAKPESASHRRNVQAILLGHSFSFDTDAGVFSKQGVDFGSRLLIEGVEIHSGDRVLDLGCGYGPIGIALATHYRDVQVTMVDINERAVKLAATNRVRHCPDQQVEILVSDGFSTLSTETKFDLIVTNPPIRAGKEVIYRWFGQAAAHLAPNGRLWIVMRKQQGANSAYLELSQHFPSVQVMLRKKGYWLIQGKIY